MIEGTRKCDVRHIREAGRNHTVGVATSLPWGVNFGDGVFRHPTQLYESAFALVLGIFLWRLTNRPHTEGDIFKAFMVAYFGFRLACDFLKPDIRVVAGLSSIQCACLAMLCYYAEDIVRWSRMILAGGRNIEISAGQSGEILPVTERTRPYLFYDVAVTICSRCFRKLEGKIVFQDGGVYLLKRCPEHGAERVLVADDVDYYRRCREVFIKKPEMPLVYNTPVKWGCPYDCGLCTDHEQHSCLTLIEVTDSCNLRCPVCYSSSGPERVEHRPLSLIEKMLDAVVRNEGNPDVVQISGGEPTIHPDFFKIIAMAQARPIRHLMVNTNGVRIAQDEEFVKQLADLGPDFEIYLQFDSFERNALMDLRGADLRAITREGFGTA